MAACLSGLRPQGSPGSGSSCLTPEALSWLHGTGPQFQLNSKFTMCPNSHRDKVSSVWEANDFWLPRILNYTDFLSFPLHFKPFLYNTSHKLFPRNSFIQHISSFWLLWCLLQGVPVLISRLDLTNFSSPSQYSVTLLHMCACIHLFPGFEIG